MPITLLIAFLVLGAIFAPYRSDAFEMLVENRDALRQLVAQHRLLVVAGFACIYGASVALSIPLAAILSICGGTMFGGWLGGTVSVVAATSGATALFMLARTALGQNFAERASPRLSCLLSGFRSGAVSYLLFLRLVPVFPFALVNLACALAGVRAGIFIWTTCIGILPATFAFSFAGAGLDEVLQQQIISRHSCLAAGRADCHMALSLDVFLSRNLLYCLIILGILALIPLLARRIWKKDMAVTDLPATDEPASDRNMPS